MMHMQALVDYGFLYVINHGIDEATMKSVYAESKKFFEQPMEEKMALEKNSSHRGYIRPDFEGFEADAGGKGENMIYHASFPVTLVAGVKPRIFIENPNPCTIAIVPGSVAITYRTSHR
jgi:isopenicillin N synthase-like dioxygenase